MLSCKVRMPDSPEPSWRGLCELSWLNLRKQFTRQLWLICPGDPLCSIILIPNKGFSKSGNLYLLKPGNLNGWSLVLKVPFILPQDNLPFLLSSVNIFTSYNHVIYNVLSSTMFKFLFLWYNVLKFSPPKTRVHYFKFSFTQWFISRTVQIRFFAKCARMFSSSTPWVFFSPQKPSEPCLNCLHFFHQCSFLYFHNLTKLTHEKLLTTLPGIF